MDQDCPMSPFQNEKRRWYVVRTRPRSEEIAARHLGRHDVGVYLPRLALKPFQSAGLHGRELTEPLFPGYLFAELDLSSHFRAVSRTPGVRNFLCFGGELPSQIDPEIISTLRERSSGDVFQPRDTLQRGTSVHLLSGPFAGLLGVVDRPLNGAGRVSVLLQILSRQTRVEVPRGALAVA